VGRPIEQQQPGSGREAPRLELGPPGLTGLVQVNRRADLSPEDVERYLLFYAQNQSIALDLEILAKALLLSVRKEGK
jgi:lipopolysaccharide/colanic/teichoic acid biosynthesis glycosyltransferase